MREDVLATRLLLEDFRKGCRLGDDETYGPSFHERVCAAFPGKKRPSWDLKCTSGSFEGHVLEGGGEGAAGREFRNRGQGGGALFVR